MKSEAERSAWWQKPTYWLTLVLLANSAFLLADRSPAMLYVANVFAHLGFGSLLILTWAILGWHLIRTNALKKQPFLVSSFLSLAGIATMTGIGLVVYGNLHAQRPLLYTHIVTSAGACLTTLLWFLKHVAVDNLYHKLGWGIFALAVVIPASQPLWPPRTDTVVANPILAPLTLTEESMGGASGPFFPSAVETVSGGEIPSDFFMESQTCGEAGCHPDIYDQWASSAHHFSSFNNQWYRKSIEYMQDIVGLEAPQWCSGCHDPALLFAGKMKQPVSDFIDTPEAHAGLGCVACHSVVHVNNTMGNGGYVMEYPKMHDLATSENPLVKEVHDFLVKVAPGPHKEAFLKPIHTTNSPELCASCHKVHLDQEVNNYRWIRGFNSYDNWQASGVSGEGARSFYYPPEPMVCTDCHMPLVKSNDAGNKNGYVKSHRFPAANTALPTANRDTTQLNAVKEFLTNNQVKVDIFTVSEPQAGFVASPIDNENRGDPTLNLSSTFAVGEEQGMQLGGGGLTREATAVVGPLSPNDTVLLPGTSVRLDVVVRTLNVGHFFPSGTVDAQEVWLEVKAVDANDQVLFWSGFVEDEGKGPVDPGARFYRSVMVDADGNKINKRNAWASRSVVYVNLIPPGAADVGHYRLNIPEDVGDSVTITAKLHYRKFDWWHTQFAYAGIPDTTVGGTVSVHADNRSWTFDGDLSNVSGALKSIPNVPIVTMAEDQLTLQVSNISLQPVASEDSNPEFDRMRWNDYGIGLLLEGDLKGAEYAFRQVTTLDPTYADGWINLARVYLQEGALESAAEVLVQAEIVQPDFHKTYYFRGLMHKAYGDYDDALADLKQVAEQYPKDRVVLNQIGRVYYLNAQPAEAIPYFHRALQIDSEDLMAHYNLMFCYRALGEIELSEAHEKRYLRYKDDEAARATAQDYRRANPHDNNMAQPINEHYNSYMDR